MKNFLTLLVCLVIFSPLNAQQKQPPPGRIVEESVLEDVPRIISMALPRYDGQPCQESFSKWCRANLKYPIIALENDIQGSVLIGFTVGSDGLLRDPNVIQSSDHFLDSAALAVVKQAPQKWTPARQNGRATTVQCTVNITFIVEY